MSKLIKTLLIGSCCLYPFSINAKACDQEKQSKIHNEAFSITQNGTIKHLPSGLEFKQCLEGQINSNKVCKGQGTQLSWLEAENHANKHIFNQKNDWRLPKIEELQILLDQSCKKPKLLMSLFPLLTSGQIWSASPGAPVNDHSVVLNISDGKIYGVGRGVKREVLLVRGKPSSEWLEQEPPSDWVAR